MRSLDAICLGWLSWWGSVAVTLLINSPHIVSFEVSPGDISWPLLVSISIFLPSSLSKPETSSSSSSKSLGSGSNGQRQSNYFLPFSIIAPHGSSLSISSVYWANKNVKFSSASLNLHNNSVQLHDASFTVELSAPGACLSLIYRHADGRFASFYFRLLRKREIPILV